LPQNSLILRANDWSEKKMTFRFAPKFLNIKSKWLIWKKKWRYEICPKITGKSQKNSATSIQKFLLKLQRSFNPKKMEKLFPGLWQVSYRDEYEDGIFKEKWRLKLSNAKKNRFIVERELEDGSFVHIHRRNELSWNKLTNNWSMYTSMSVIHVVEFCEA